MNELLNTMYVTVDEAIRYARDGADSIRSGYDSYDVYCASDLEAISGAEIVREIVNKAVNGDEK